MAIRKVLPRLGWTEVQQQPELLPVQTATPANPNLSALCVEPSQRLPAMTLIQVIVPLTGCWPDLDCWRTPLRCSDR